MHEFYIENAKPGNNAPSPLANIQLKLVVTAATVLLEMLVTGTAMTYH